MSSDSNAAGQQLAAAAAAAAAQSNSPQQQATQPAAPSQPANSTPVSSDSSKCMWEGCNDRFNGPEALYEHICDRHIGRKSTNNLNLECHWANCKTKTVKRDHITSHVRVHVPHKPHRCPICNKAFKRPQDLKKHHKTHAEDSGPPNSSHNGQGPNGHQGGPPHNGYGGMGGGPGPGAFGYPHMQGGVGMNFGGYQGQPGAYYTQPHQNMGGHYSGTVYYNVGDGGPGTQASYGRQDNGVQALNHLVETIKQPTFDATSYAQFSPALVQMHGITLPTPFPSHGVDYSAPHLESAFAQPIPQLSNIRGKSDLLLLEDRLQKMMNAIETHDRTAVPVVPMQPGSNSAHYPGPQIPAAAQTGAATNDQTPALTPGSTASPGHSPSSDHSSIVSPTSAGVPAYPHLQGNMSFTAPGQTVSVPTLGNQYDANNQQRRTGGRLTRAAPNGPESAITASQASGSKKRSSKVKREVDANIDPALTGPPTSSSSGSEATTTPNASNSGEEPSWLQDVRIIEDVLKLVKGMLVNHQYDGSRGMSEDGEDGSAGGTHDPDAMEDVKHEISYPELSAMTK